MDNVKTSNLEQEVKKTFITECKNNIEIAEECILSIESNPSSSIKAFLDDLFRALHTIKGGSGFLGMSSVTDLSHELENLVECLRNETFALNSEIIEILLSGIDKLKELFESNNPSQISIEAQLQTLKQFHPESKTNNFKIKAVEDIKTNEDSPYIFNLQEFDVTYLRKEFEYLFNFTVDLTEECKRINVTPQDFIASLANVGTIIKIKLHPMLISPLTSSKNNFLPCSFLLGTIIDNSETIIDALNLNPIHYIFHKTLNLNQNKKQTHIEIKTDISNNTKTTEIQNTNLNENKKTPRTSIRIPTLTIEHLMNLASELVLLRNQNLLAIETKNMDTLTYLSRKLNSITTDIQDTIIQTRMQPINSIFKLFKRIVRNLGNQLGKKVDLKIIGGEVELDKNIIDNISEPLTHLIRNSLDHGIELPDERIAKGKSPEGELILKASQYGGQVIIEVKDNGCGMSSEKLKKAALEKKIITEDEVANLSDDDALKLIFMPNFSSAKTITDISGRGIGMNAVKESLRKIGGIIEIKSQPDIGTTIQINLPLTMAIIPALIVQTENHFFAIPQVNILEVIWFQGSDLYQKIERTCDREVLRHRNSLIPLVKLSDILDIKKSYTANNSERYMAERREHFYDRRQKELPTKDDRRSGIKERRTSLGNSQYFIILKMGNDEFALLTDKIIDTQEIVVKPIHDQLKSCKIFSGVTFLGDGNITMILDIPGIAAEASIQLNNFEFTPQTTKAKTSQTALTFLLFDIGKDETFALPLGIVKRVEKINIKDIQIRNEKEYIYIKNITYPVMRLEDLYKTLEAKYKNDEAYIIITSIPDTPTILAATIQDAVETYINLNEKNSYEQGILGYAPINGNITMFLDIPSLAKRFLEEAYTIHDKDIEYEVLLIDDSPLHISYLSSMLKKFNIKVHTAYHGQEAISILQNEKINFIVSDIEMPVMNGLEFARWVRSQKQYQNMPLLAVSSGDESIYRSSAIKAGFNQFCPKNDHAMLFDILTQIYNTIEREKK